MKTTTPRPARQEAPQRLQVRCLGCGLAIEAELVDGVAQYMDADGTRHCDCCHNHLSPESHTTISCGSCGRRYQGESNG
jgi:hypothetical protein